MRHRNWPAAFACAVALVSGAYLCTHDCPVIGGAVLIACFVATWGFEKD